MSFSNLPTMLLSILKITFTLFAFTSLSSFIALSVLKAIRYFEENPYGSKVTVQSILRSTTLLHSVLIILKIPFKLILISILGQIAYLSMLDDYPMIKFKDKRMFLGLVTTVFTHFYFVVLNSKMNSNVVRTMFTYYIIWLNPVLLCIVICANDGNMLCINKR